MNSHNVAVALYLLLAGAGLMLQLLSLRAGSRLPSLGSVLHHVMRRRPGRVGVVAAWLWLGLHFFAH